MKIQKYFARVIIATYLLFNALSAQADEKSTGASTPQIVVRGLAYPLRDVPVFVLPGEELPVRVSEDGTQVFENAVKISLQSGGRLQWNTPKEPGIYLLKVKNQNLNFEANLRVFVMYPLSNLRDGVLNNYPMGEYISDTKYKLPLGFIQVTSTNENTRLTPHFVLRQFVSKGPGEGTKFIVLEEKLLLKLELLIEALGKKEVHVSTLAVMSGYRTPLHNSLLKNVRQSQHIYGFAADVFVDEKPKDGVMDDLNKDGEVTVEDARWLAQVVEDLEKNLEAPLIGGLSAYVETPAHGPFVHVDTRGIKARW